MNKQDLEFLLIELYADAQEQQCYDDCGYGPRPPSREKELKQKILDGFDQLIREHEEHLDGEKRV